MDSDSCIYQVLDLICGKMQGFGANRDFFSKFWLFVTFAHSHKQCLMTTQDFRILKDKGVQEHKIQGIFGVLRQILSPANKNISINWIII